MGEFADMFMDESFFDFSDLDYDTDLGGGYSRRELRCKHCNKGKLAWRQVKKTWVLMEKTGKVHSCHGYEPPLDILKELAKETLAETRKEAMWKLQDKAKKRGGIKRLINILSDADLVDLYACFVRDDQRDHDFPDVGMGSTYKNELSALRTEILHRISKP